MGFWAFLILVVLILVGAWFYRRLLEVEKDIRQEMAAEAMEFEAEPEPPMMASEEAEVAPQKVVLTTSSNLESTIVDLVSDNPGLLQTELYPKIPDIQRKPLQDLLRKMDKKGTLRREKEKGSYRLYPA